MPALSDVSGIVLNDFIPPLQAVSLVCLHGGILMIGFSIAYPGLSSAGSAQKEMNPASKESLVD